MKKIFINWKANKQFCLSLLVGVVFLCYTGHVFAETNSVTILTTINSIPSSSLPTMSHHAYSSGLSPIDSSLLFLMGVTSYAIGTLLLLEKNIYWLFIRRNEKQFQNSSSKEVKNSIKKSHNENLIDRATREIYGVDEVLLPIERLAAL